ncbi:PAS domain S-box protein (plasmid) [Skermanella rosea]|uniref:hybrid sensor histidine kinase/response regulator n=1 Tax=Skermanella rosea TaxID=1817965 RepID=UPI001931A988|nr:PAS domain S-box protein [Skermanella rosea]UEM07855.1 PAS domain S-box protein [Skermanella rosea]
MAPGPKYPPLLHFYHRQSEALFGGLRNGRAAKRALEQSERRFRAIVEDQTEMICRFGADFRINFSNRAHARFVGDEPETLLGRDFLDSFPARIQKSLRAGLEALTPEDPILRCEHDRTTPAGEVQWFAWTNRALFDEAGHCLGYQSVGRDITARKRAEDALRESEMRFRTIVEDQTEFISRCTPDFRFTFVNEAYARQLERPREEIIGSSVLKLMTPDQRTQFIAQLLELTPSNPTVSYEMSSAASDGRLLWEQWTDRALFDERGQLVGYQSVGRDISKSKTIEATLKASAEELALIADCMPVAMAIARTDPTEILFSNSRARESFGLYPGCPPDRITAIYEDLSDRDRLLGLLSRHGNVEGFELSLRRADGTVIRALISARTIQFRGASAVVAAITDITSRLQTEQALRTSEARLQAFMQHAPAGMFLKDLDGRYIVANPEMEKVQNRPISRIIGRTPQDVFAPEDAALIRYYDQQVLNTGAAVVNEEHVPYMPHYPWRMVVRFPIRGADGQITHIAGFIFDISSRKNAEAEADRQRAAMHQRDKLAALGSLLAGVAHELNNPLSVVLGRAIMLEEESTDAAIRESLGRLRVAAERCARIVKSFLALARQKAREPKPVDVRAVLEGSMEILASGLRSAGIEVVREDPPDLPMVLADEDELHQVFMNIIINAQQALEAAPPDQVPGSGRTVWVSTAHDAAAGTVRIEIADNGPGVPEAVRGQIFDPFFTTKPIGSGTGLGLSVCHGIISAHGGSIAVEDRPGGGALFRVTLDACRAPAETASAMLADGDCGNGTVLVVDDEPEVVSLLEEILKREGYRVETADNGASALELLRDRRFDAILCDIRMPLLDGAGLLRMLEAHRPDLAGRVLLMTGDVLRAAATLPAGARARLLEKPLDPVEVRRRLRDMVGRRP